MENKNIETSFKYTYSAREQEEIKRIRKKYQSPEVNGIDKLRKLDSKVTQKATSMSLIVGILGALIMGFGMSLIMTNLSTILGMPEMLSMAVGILTGLLGIMLTAMAYPTYKKVVKKEREKAAPEILKLTEELMK